MKTLLTTLLMASVSMMTPAYADSLRDVANATVGMAGPTSFRDLVREISRNGTVAFTGSTDGTRSQSNHDIINPDTVTVTGGQYVGGGSSEPHIGPSPAANGRGWWNEKCQTIAAVNDDCTVQSMNPGHGGSYSPLVTTRTANAPTPVADSVIDTVTTTTVNVGYDPRGGFNGFSISTGSVTADK